MWRMGEAEKVMIHVGSELNAEKYVCMSLCTCEHTQLCGKEVLRVKIF